jgi:phage tail sheath protein FI
MSLFTTKQPGVFLQDIRIQPQSIEGVSTNIAAFLGETETGPTIPTLTTSFADYKRLFGGYLGNDKYLPHAVEGFFLNGGQKCYVCRVLSSNYAEPLAKLEVVDEVSIVYSPNAQAVPGLAELLIGHCERLRYRFAILDSVKGQNISSVTKPKESAFAAIYYPWIYVKLAGTGPLCLVPPGGHVAGIYARIDLEMGVNKAPANAIVRGAVDIEYTLSSNQQDNLVLQGINCIRNFVGRDIRVWGSRTLSGEPTKKYVNVCRLLMYLEQSITKGTMWAVFEPNNDATWAKVKRAIDNFLMQTWKNGFLMGVNSQEAYFVKIDRTTMTQSDIDNGRLIVLIGIAPVKPAEFIIIRINQTTLS